MTHRMDPVTPDPDPQVGRNEQHSPVNARPLQPQEMGEPPTLQRSGGSHWVGMLRIPETQPPTPSPVPATVTDSPNMRYRTYPSHTCNNQTGMGCCEVRCGLRDPDRGTG